MKARRAFLADGSTITTEAGPDGCWDSQEISDVEIEMDDEWTCDICGTRYDPLDYEDEEQTNEGDVG